MFGLNFLGGVFFHPIDEQDHYVARKNYFLVPVYGDIPCGPPNFVDDELKGHLEIPDEMIGNGEYFVLRAKGDSMTGAGILAGDLVIIQKQNYAEEAQIVVAYVDGETTLKRFYKNDQQKLVELRPENDKYKPIFASDCLILGVAVKIIKDIY